ncbi:MAG: general stress protein [Planctomycetes bacterium]|nr:general stress protein [Planctomycetota bacterium]
MKTDKALRTTAVGVFHDREAAQEAVAELRRLGFSEEEIGVAYRGHEDVAGGSTSGGDGSHAAEGAGVGAAAGAGLGALWGLGVVAGALPAIGPAIAGGTMAAILTSAAAGAAAAGLTGALVGAGIPAAEAEFYEGEFRAGRFVVTVHAERRYEEAAGALRRHGGYDMHNREVHPHPAPNEMTDLTPRKPR